VLLKKETIFTIVDYMENVWKCNLSFSVSGDMVLCRFGGDWRSICRACNLVQGDAVKLTAVEEGNDVVLSLGHIPLQRTHCTYVRPVNGAGKYIYQLNHYIMSCPAKRILV